jgi:hypothetical protein
MLWLVIQGDIITVANPYWGGVGREVSELGWVPSSNAAGKV